jgi:hypothetical protein
MWHDLCFMFIAARVSLRAIRTGKRPAPSGRSEQQLAIPRETRRTENDVNIIELATKAGMAVLLDGKIGQEEYVSVSGSLAALARFAEAVRTATTPAQKAQATQP